MAVSKTSKIDAMTNAQKRQEVVIDAKCERFINDLVETRKKLGLKVDQLSKLTGISQPNLTRMENSRSNPNLRTIMRVCAALNLKISLSDSD